MNEEAGKPMRSFSAPPPMGPMKALWRGGGVRKGWEGLGGVGEVGRS